MSRQFGYTLVGALLAISISSGAQAGVYTDDLSRCLIQSTTPNDRTLLVRWMFAAAASHPAVKSIAAVTAADLDTANKQTGALFMRLLTEACRDEAKAALKFEGQSTIEASFNAFGQVAGRELFSSPEVTAGMAGLGTYIDQEKLQALTQ